MNITIINGTYHKDGVISSLIDSFINGVKKINDKANINIYNLIDIDTKFCKGCSSCNKNDGKTIGECSIKDGTEKILQNMLDSDLLVYACPIYEYSITAIMKRFMERSMPLLLPGKGIPKYRNKIRKNKNGIIILSSGAPTPINKLMGMTKYPLMILKWFTRAFACNKIFKIIAGGMHGSNKTKRKYLNESYNLGMKLALKFNATL
jgi:multimeric flavodoxin WrbA